MTRKRVPRAGGAPTRRSTSVHTNGTTHPQRTGYFCPGCGDAVISGDDHQCKADVPSVEELIDAGAKAKQNRVLMTESVQDLTKSFLHAGAKPEDIATVYDGEAQNIRVKIERDKRERRGRK